mmetsp:Transcript_618/g.1706  ORF Transcript_618/g.1706 Transcript_618/m.1706 type:complete len:247 (-) Transcript_618:1075-1815(-)
MHHVRVHAADHLVAVLEHHLHVRRDGVVREPAHERQHTLGDADRARHARRLDHVAEERVGPEDVVARLFGADDPGGDRAVVDADAHLHRRGAVVRVQRAHHREGHLEHRRRVTLRLLVARAPRVLDAALPAAFRQIGVLVGHDDVRVADGLHLEEAVLQHQRVELRVELLQRRDHLGGRALGGHVGEALNVRVEQQHVLQFVCDLHLLAQLGHHGGRHHVVQQLVSARHLLVLAVEEVVEAALGAL